LESFICNIVNKQAYVANNVIGKLNNSNNNLRQKNTNTNDDTMP